MARVAIIGGGVIGSVAAFALQRRGHAVTLIDRDAQWRGASIGNAGHIAANEVAPMASFSTLRKMPRNLFSRGGPVALPLRDIGAWLPFGLRLLAATRRYDAGLRALCALQAEALPALQRLIADLGAPELLREKGHFIVWDSTASAAAGKAELARMEMGTATWRDANAGELAMLASLSSPPGGAVRVSGTGQITDLSALETALAKRFAETGGARMQGDARADAQGARLASGERVDADLVVIAAGPASAPLLAPFGHRVPLIAERGYHIETDGGDWPADMPSILFADRATFVTRFANRLRATSFVEFGRAHSPPDPRKWQRLRAHARDLGLPFDGAMSEWMGARPTLPDYLPAIGRSRAAPHVFYAFGHQHLGLTLAAITGESIAALVAGNPASVDLAPFAIERF